MSIDTQLNTLNQLISTDISDELELIDANFSPVVSYLYRSGRRAPTNSTIIEWVDNHVRKTRSTLSAALSAGATSVTAADDEIFVKDAVLAIDDELILITAVAGTPATATVTRGFAGTTDTNHLINAEVRNLGIQMAEGGDFKKSVVTLPEVIQNRTGIIYEDFEITESAKHTAIQGQSGMSAYQLESMKKKQELMAQLENKILNGVTYNTGLERDFDGIKSLIKKHGIEVDATSATLTKAYFDEIGKMIVDAGGAADLTAGRYFVLVPYTQKNKIDNFNEQYLRTGIQEKVTGTTITQIVTTGGILNVFHADSLGANEMLIVSLDNATIKELYPVREEIAAKTGLKDQYVLHGEMTLELKKCPFQVHVKNLAI